MRVQQANSVSCFIFILFPQSPLCNPCFPENYKTTVMKKSAPVALALFVFVLVTGKTQAQAFTPEVSTFIKVRQGSIALTDVKIIDGRGGPAKEHQAILLQNEGTCPCCDQKTTFIARDAWYRDHYVCSSCGSSE